MEPDQNSKCAFHPKKLADVFCISPGCPHERLACSLCVSEKHSSHSQNNTIDPDSDIFKKQLNLSELSEQDKKSTITLCQFYTKELQQQQAKTIKKMLEAVNQWQKNFECSVKSYKIIQNCCQDAEYYEKAHSTVMKNEKKDQINQISYSLKLFMENNFKYKQNLNQQLAKHKNRCKKMLDDFNKYIVNDIQKLNLKFVKAKLNKKVGERNIIKSDISNQSSIIIQSSIISDIYDDNKSSITQDSSIIYDPDSQNLNESVDMAKLRSQFAKKPQTISKILDEDQQGLTKNLLELTKGDKNSICIQVMGGKWVGISSIQDWLKKGKQLNEIEIFGYQSSNWQIIPYQLILLENTLKLSLSSNKIETITSILMPHLVYLNLSGNKIKKIQSLDNLVDLKVLRLASNSIQQIINLQRLKNLTQLNLHSNKIKKIQGLQQLTDLRHLHLEDNQIQRINNLKTLTKLQTLDLSSNPIQKIQNIQNLISLKELRIISTKISKLQGLKTLKSLNKLIAFSNEIKVIEGLQNQTKLQVLNLRDNKIQKIQEKPLSFSKRLKQIYIYGNPAVQQVSSKVVIQFLKNNKIKVIDQQPDEMKNLQILIETVQALQTIKGAGKPGNPDCTII